MAWTNKQLNSAEEAVIKLSEATNLTDKEIVEIIADGFDIKYKGILPDDIRNLIDELCATFDIL